MYTWIMIASILAVVAFIFSCVFLDNLLSACDGVRKVEVKNRGAPRRDIEQGGSGTFEVEDDGLDQKLLTKVSHLKTTNLGTRELLLRRMKKKYYQSQKFKSRNL